MERGDSSRVFLRKWAWVGAPVGGSSKGTQEQRQAGGGGAHSSRAVERALWLQSLTWIKLGSGREHLRSRSGAFVTT